LFVAKEGKYPNPIFSAFCAILCPVGGIFFYRHCVGFSVFVSLFEKEQTPAGQMKQGTHRQNDDFLLDFDKA
jgi:hypothetical protein